MGKLNSIYAIIVCFIFTICIYHVLTDNSSSQWYDISVYTILAIVGVGFIIALVKLLRGKRKKIFYIIYNIVIVVCLLVYLNTTDGAGHFLSTVFLWGLCILFIIGSFFVAISGLLAINKWSNKK